ncbi:STAS domain-containing protein [Oceanirhabdus sp. W0125-5]|uniref:STAS domain-containing protein n=1 Tax=Oceanirhabdus sp. W0125-5 TaxID=2999116 RepID=UPI0022F2FF7E|nr:STAS domain-containing protein [Oceanirhabdus sp. W0125-5]WBW95368.1 STAS domain-containing protein [Oceanirhabdus sp. W0125-5]
MKEINLVIPENFAVDEAAEFREKVNHLIIEGEKNFKLDFKNCTFIDSTGLGVLVSIYKKCKELNGSFHIYGVNNPKVMKIFKLTRLDNVLQIEK